MSIITNIEAAKALNARRLSLQATATASERLSSALRINRGADNPSGLAISKGMTAQARGYNTATGNCQDGINLLQTMDGGLAQIHDILIRMRELAVRGANDATLTQSDRNKLQNENNSLKSEITQIADATTYNEKHILTGGAEPGVYSITFCTNRDGNYEIYSMNTDGSNPVNLTNNAAWDLEPSFSPDGSKIAFRSNRNGNYEIYVMNSDGSNQVRLTNNPALDGEPVWSPDGSKIAFSSYSTGGGDIYVMNSDGSNQVRLTNNPAADWNPAWSPDGSKIAFTTSRDGNAEIYVMNSDGSNQVNLTNSPLPDTRPAWSPDGSRIAFESQRTLNGEVFVMNSDGSNQINLTNNPSSDGGPAWSPDGSKISFSTSRVDISEIFIMNPDGSNPVNLSNNPAQDFKSSYGGVISYPYLQVGPDNGADYRIQITLPDARAASIGAAGATVSTAAGARNAITAIDNAIAKVSSYRAEEGTMQKKLELIVNDNSLSGINISASNSRLEDADIASETVDLAREQIKQTTNAEAIIKSDDLSRSVLDLLDEQAKALA
ncbi:MAG: flagellin [bacterium]